MTHCYSAVQK